MSVIVKKQHVYKLLVSFYIPVTVSEAVDSIFLILQVYLPASSMASSCTINLRKFVYLFAKKVVMKHRRKTHLLYAFKKRMTFN